MDDYRSQMKLTETEQKHISDLGELIEEGFKSLGNLNIQWNKIRQRKRILLMIFTGVHYHTKSIRDLLADGRTASAEVIMRTILESSVNAQYVLTGRNNEAVNNFIQDGNARLLEQIDKMLRFRSAHPNADTNAGHLTVKKLNDVKTQKTKEINNYKASYQYNFAGKLPSLRLRSQIVDDDFKRLRGVDPKITSEWNYLIVYWLISEHSHASFIALREFVGTNEQGDKVAFFLDGTKKDFDRIAATTYALYVDLLSLINRQFHIVDGKRLQELKALGRQKMRD